MELLSYCGLGWKLDAVKMPAFLRVICKFHETPIKISEIFFIVFIPT